MATMTKKRRQRQPMTPDGIRSLREQLGLTVEQAAEKVGVTSRAWRSWEQPSQDRRPSPSHEILIRLLEDGTI